MGTAGCGTLAAFCREDPPRLQRSGLSSVGRAKSVHAATRGSTPGPSDSA